MKRILALGCLLGFAGCPGSDPSPSPSPTPPEVCFAPLPGAAGDYVPVAWKPSELLWVVIEIREKTRHQCWPGQEDIPLERLAAELRAEGFCAVKNEDRVLIQRTDGLYEEHHAIAYATGCWASAARMYLGTLAFIGAAP